MDPVTLIVGAVVVVSVVFGAVDNRRQQRKIVEQVSETVSATSEGNREVLAQAMRDELEELAAREEVVGLDRRITCGEEASAWGVYTCTVALSQKVCEEAGVEAGERVAACAALTATAESLGEMLACHDIAESTADHYRDGYPGALAKCLDVVD